MRKLRVIHVTTDLNTYPGCRENNEEFPHLVERLVEDDFESFVVDEDGGYWTTREFFDCTSITHFIVDSSEAPE